MKYKLFVVFILVGVLYRFIPHLPNFSPIGAISLFSGFYFSKKYSWIIPLIIMFISDYFLGFNSVSLYVYISFLIASSVGYFLKKSDKAKYFFFASITSSFLFYLITNFGVWNSTAMYPKTINGLYESYLMAIPFFRSTLVSDVIYSSVLFSVYFLSIKNVNSNQLFAKNTSKDL